MNEVLLGRTAVKYLIEFVGLAGEGRVDADEGQQLQVFMVLVGQAAIEQNVACHLSYIYNQTKSKRPNLKGTIGEDNWGWGRADCWRTEEEDGNLNCIIISWKLY